MATENKYIYGLGRRKTAIAQVRLYIKGSGKFTVNGRDALDYFPAAMWQERIYMALSVAGLKGVADVSVRTLGGGIRAQADAVSLGIARALVKMDEELRITMKPDGLLSRDPRVKERKKPGLKKARKAPQWSKR